MFLGLICVKVKTNFSPWMKEFFVITLYMYLLPAGFQVCTNHLYQTILRCQCLPLLSSPQPADGKLCNWYRRKS